MSVSPSQPVGAGTVDLPPPQRTPGVLVYLCGIATTVVVMFIVQAISGAGENVMGWYANGVIPAGALLVGVASGTGYAIGSRVLQVKLSKAFVIGMVTTGVADWVALQYFEYTSALDRYHINPLAFGFVAYLQQITEGMSFSRGHSGEPGSPLGALGYVFKALELAGFAGGTMMPSAILFKLPYCASCRMYLKAHGTFTSRSTLSRKEALAGKKPQKLAQLQQAVNEASERALGAAHVVGALSLSDTVAAFTAMQSASPTTEKPAAIVTVTIKKCPRCEAHHVACGLRTFAANGQLAQAHLLTIDKTAAPAAVLRQAAA